MKNELNGLLLFNKPLFLSSNSALQKVKRLYNAVKAGHTGTLDPMATGLLPICFGEATKFARFLLDADKEYIATIKLGVATTTYDTEGEITATNKVNVNTNDITQAIKSFIGNITQIPPIYSALKVNGKPLYQYARSNQEVIIQSRQITIHKLEILKFVAPDILEIKILCSKGTYIRSLAHDIGVKLGCGAHLIALIRTKTSGFELNPELTLENLQKLNSEQLLELILPVDSLVLHLNKFVAADADYAYLRHGHAFSKDLNLINDTYLRLYYNDQFLGVANFQNQKIIPLRLINTN